MKKENKAAKAEVKTDVNPAEVSHLKSGHKWMAWVLGLTALWVLVTFVKGLMAENDLPVHISYLNVWYLCNMGLFTVLAAYATFTILKKCPSQIFWSSTVMFGLLLQSVSLIILYFFRQDTAAINGVALFVWGICWYTYMITSTDVESDLPARHRNHSKLGNYVLYLVVASTVLFGLFMVFNLLW